MENISFFKYYQKLQGYNYYINGNRVYKFELFWSGFNIEEIDSEHKIKKTEITK